MILGRLEKPKQNNPLFDWFGASSQAPEPTQPNTRTNSFPVISGNTEASYAYPTGGYSFLNFSLQRTVMLLACDTTEKD